MRKWFLLLCFNITRGELARWYKKNESSLTHGEWKEYYETMTYLKRYTRYQLEHKKKRGS